MGAESPYRTGTQAASVFLSYASEDTAAAERICEALRAAGIEVWFDQSELRGGDVWDQKIRRQIHDCALFVPIISANTASRQEGYFRLEWDLADQRTHMMARDRAFILPVCLDATPRAGTDVPESFHRVQWTRLPNSETPPEFVARIKRLLSPEPLATAGLSAGPISGASPIPRTTSRSAALRRALLVAVALLALAALAYLLINKPWISKPAAILATSSATSSPGAPSAAFVPPPHSIAVLPFVNMSGDKEQEYFSDGLTEEILNSLARISELQVSARTSAFSFKGKDVKISTIARELNVASILEGSVRRSGRTIRITAQLNNAVTGFHLWSQTYDRDLSDVLKLQTDIANAVADALKITLLGHVAAKIELGGTRNPAAFDAYLRGSNADRTVHNAHEAQAAVALYTEAIRQDPHYAQAFAARSLARFSISLFAIGVPAIRENLDAQQADAREALRLAPDLGEGHLALARSFEDALDFLRAGEEFQRALALAPGNARTLRSYGLYTVTMGRTDAGIAALQRAVVLDPLNPSSHRALGSGLDTARQYPAAIAAYEHALVLDPDSPQTNALRGFSYFARGDFEHARASCEARPEFFLSQTCLAMIYDKLGRRADAEATLAKLKASSGDTDAYQYAQIYAQWGDHAKALEWLETAVRLHDLGLAFVKTDHFLDPLRKEPRFQAVERKLKFPD